jgi:hypothetical protein
MEAITCLFYIKLVKHNRTHFPSYLVTIYEHISLAIAKGNINSGLIRVPHLQPLAIKRQRKRETRNGCIFANFVFLLSSPPPFPFYKKPWYFLILKND